MSYTENITIREVYASIFSTEVIEELFRKGLEIDNDRLAISALDELILRDESTRIARSLNVAFRKGWLREESSLVALLGRTLKENGRGVGPHLYRYGIGLCRGDFQAPTEWTIEHAKELGDHNSDVVCRAKIWASTIDGPGDVPLSITRESYGDFKVN